MTASVTRDLFATLSQSREGGTLATPSVKGGEHGHTNGAAVAVSMIENLQSRKLEKN